MSEEYEKLTEYCSILNELHGYDKLLVAEDEEGDRGLIDCDDEIMLDSSDWFYDLKEEQILDYIVNLKQEVSDTKEIFEEYFSEVKKFRDKSNEILNGKDKIIMEFQKISAEKFKMINSYSELINEYMKLGGSDE